MSRPAKALKPTKASRRPPPSPARSATSDTEGDEEDDYDKSGYEPQPHSPLALQWASTTSSKLEALSLSSSPPTSSTNGHAPRSHISSLPPEILIHVFRQLSSTRDVHAVLLVSRGWCECAVELLWHKPHFSQVSSLFKLVQIISRKDQTFTYARFIRRLNFATMGRELNDQIFTRLSLCTRLERLTLVGCDDLSDESLRTVLSCTPNLVALDLTCVKATTDATICALAAIAPKLQGVNLGACDKITDISIHALARHCPMLRRVKLSGIPSITDKPIIEIATNCPLLIEVDLNSCAWITDAAVRCLWKHGTHLREMRLAHCEELTDLAFPVPPPPSTDRPNPFTQPPAPTPAPAFPPLILTNPLVHLRQLELTAVKNLTDEAVAGIIANAPKLRNLVLAKCTQLTDAAVSSICKLGRYLHYLHLGHASCITDASVCALARSCTRLRYIDLACCTLLTDMSVFELSSLPKLRRIGLVRVVNLTDDALFHLAERYATLERIHLSYCENISVFAVHFLLQKLHKLTHLSLTGIPAFRRAELQRFCRSPPKDFTQQQREAFCVYSGRGVSDLRRYLETIASTFQYMNGGEESDGDGPSSDDGDEDEDATFGDETTGLTVPQADQPATSPAHAVLHSQPPLNGSTAVPALPLVLQLNSSPSATLPFFATSAAASAAPNNPPGGGSRNHVTRSVSPVGRRNETNATAGSTSNLGLHALRRVERERGGPRSVTSPAPSVAESQSPASASGSTSPLSAPNGNQNRGRLGFLNLRSRTPVPAGTPSPTTSQESYLIGARRPRQNAPGAHPNGASSGTLTPETGTPVDAASTSNHAGPGPGTLAIAARRAAELAGNDGPRWSRGQRSSGDPPPVSLEAEYTTPAAPGLSLTVNGDLGATHQPIGTPEHEQGSSSRSGASLPSFDFTPPPTGRRVSGESQSDSRSPAQEQTPTESSRSTQPHVQRHYYPNGVPHEVINEDALSDGGVNPPEPGARKRRKSFKSTLNSALSFGRNGRDGTTSGATGNAIARR